MPIQKQTINQEDFKRLNKDESLLHRHFRWLMAIGPLIVLGLLIFGWLNHRCIVHITTNDQNKDIVENLFGWLNPRQCDISSAISAQPDQQDKPQTISLDGNIVSLSNNGGSFLLPNIIASAGPAGSTGADGANGATGATGPAGTPGPTVLSVSNSSTGNLLDTTVNGVTGVAVPIINSNTLGLAGSTLTSTVNGVISGGVDISNLDCSASTTVYCQGGNSFGATGVLGTNDTFDQTFITDGVERMRILSTGEFGVNTADPSLGGTTDARFSIAQDDGQTALAMANISGDPRFALNIESDGSWQMYDYVGGGWNNGIKQTAGMVGIGMTAVAKLTVGGTGGGGDAGIEWNGVASAPALSSGSAGRIYFDSLLNKFQCSENAGAYYDCFGGAAPVASADNGLSINPANNVQLGGALTQNTTITNNGYDFIFDGTGNGSGKIATFEGDVDIQGVIDPTAVPFSDSGVGSYNPITNNGYRIGVTGATQRPIFVSSLSDATRVFEVRNAADSSTILSVDSLNSRVGINNVIAPTARLDINAPVDYDNGVLVNMNPGNGSRGYTGIQVNGNLDSAGSPTYGVLDHDYLLRLVHTNPGGGSPSSFGHMLKAEGGYSGTDVTALDVLGSGDVAIGTNADPYDYTRLKVREEKLSADGVVDSTAMRIDNVSTRSDAALASTTKIGLDISSTGTWTSTLADPVNIGIKVDVSGADTNYAGIFTGGQFAVGTTTPLASHLVTINNTVPATFTRALSVFSDTNLGDHNAQISLFNNGVSGRAIRLQYVDGTDGTAMISSQKVGGGLNGNLQFITRSGGTWLEGMRLTEDGDFAIGTTSATNRLQVTDTSDDTVASFTGATQTCTVDTSGGGGWSCSSDERLKQNVLDLQNGLESVLALNSVTYNYKSNPDSMPVAGFIAQEVEKILPGLVGLDANGYKTLNKEGMIPYLVEAIKTQNGKIEGLELKLTDLENQFSELGIKVDSLSEELKELAEKQETMQKELDDYRVKTDTRIRELEERLEKMQDK